MFYVILSCPAKYAIIIVLKNSNHTTLRCDKKFDTIVTKMLILLRTFYLFHSGALQYKYNKFFVNCQVLMRLN
jgi:hypothetical protein